jgi:phage shock protein E
MRQRIISSLFVFILSLGIYAKDPDVVIIDVRTEAEWNSGYLENAIHIPLDTIEKNIILTEPDKNKEIYLYCRSGNRSGKATRILQNLGYRNVTNIGGIQSASINLNIPIVTK